MIRRALRLLGQQSIAVLALFVALSGGTAYAAAALWTGANIVDGSLTGADIANGSITSADIAPGAVTGGGSTHLADWSPAPITGQWFTTDASNGLGVTVSVASQQFTMPAAGFVTYVVSGRVDFSSDFSCSAGDEVSYAASPRIDGTGSSIVQFTGSAGGFRADSTTPGTAYLAAGEHTLDLFVTGGWCPGTGTGTATLSNVHVLVYQL